MWGARVRERSIYCRSSRGFSRFSRFCRFRSFRSLASFRISLFAFSRFLLVLLGITGRLLVGRLISRSRFVTLGFVVTSCLRRGVSRFILYCTQLSKVLPKVAILWLSQVLRLLQPRKNSYLLGKKVNLPRG